MPAAMAASPADACDCLPKSRGYWRSTCSKRCIPKAVLTRPGPIANLICREHDGIENFFRDGSLPDADNVVDGGGHPSTKIFAIILMLVALMGAVAYLAIDALTAPERTRRADGLCGEVIARRSARQPERDRPQQLGVSNCAGSPGQQPRRHATNHRRATETVSRTK